MLSGAVRATQIEVEVEWIGIQDPQNEWKDESKMPQTERK